MPPIEDFLATVLLQRLVQCCLRR